MGMFTMHPDEPGVGLLVLQDVTTLVEYCEAYRMGHIRMEGKFHLFILSAFQKDTRKLWQTAYRDAQASTSGAEMGSKIFMAFLNLFTAFSITSDKRQVLQMSNAFSYKVRGFKPTGVISWSFLVCLTTARYLYSLHCLEQWSDAKKIDFLINMFSEAGQAWVLAAMTRSGAALIITVAAVGNYLSIHMLEESQAGESCAVHTLTRSARAVGLIWLQELVHVITNCLHHAEGTSAPGATLADNQPSAAHQCTNTSAQDVARAMEVSQQLK